MVHPDGSRTLMMWNETSARNSQVHAVLRVAADFRPIETYVSYWSYGVFRGSGLYTVEGDTIHGEVSGPTGVSTQTLKVPGWFSFATHPLAGDGWHQLTIARDRKRGVQTSTLVNIDTARELNVPLIARAQQQPWEYLGETTIEVPAGKFPSTHYRSSKSEAWVSGEDRLLVRFVYTDLGSEYLLTKYQRSAP